MNANHTVQRRWLLPAMIVKNHKSQEIDVVVKVSYVRRFFAQSHLL